MRILAIPGSLRLDSFNARLLRHAAEQAPPGVEVDVWGGLGSIPPYDQDEDTAAGPPAVERLRAAIGGADALLFATPEYNSSVPGVLKNAVDWASRPRAAASLADKPAAVIGASTGSFGGVWAQAELRNVLRSAGARVLDAELAVPKAGAALAGGPLPAAIATGLAGVVAELAREAAHERAALAA